MCAAHLAHTIQKMITIDLDGWLVCDVTVTRLIASERFNEDKCLYQAQRSISRRQCHRFPDLGFITPSVQQVVLEDKTDTALR